MEAELPQRFRTDLERLIGPGEQRIGIAFSGGPDSLALLLLAHQTLGDAIAAATVDHRLRPESADEARHAARICEELGVPHAILTPAEPITGNLQSAARAARYALLEGWRARAKLDWVATAHHADDQLETVLMRLFRGSGVGGLAAIRPINQKIIRPLLAFRKIDLEAVVIESGIEPVCDPSNLDDRFDRVRMRKRLAGLPEFDPARLARSVGALREADRALTDWAAREAGRIIDTDGHSVTLTEMDWPPEMLRRLVTSCLRRIDPDIDPRGAALDRLIDALRRGRKATIGRVVAEPHSRGWRFSPAPPRRTG